MTQAAAGRASKLKPSLRERVWGRRQLAPWFPDAADPIGEAWFESDRDLPLLVKLIFTSERLSIQVHPDDGEGHPRGKTEMWHILDAAPGATIGLGFREPITRERLVESARTGEIESLVNWMPVKAGETYFTPAHTVHAIGAGVVLCEIQQNSDVTYRLYDYGRPRELHLDAATPICDLGGHPGQTAGGVVRSKHFVTEPVRLAAGERLDVEDRRCHLWFCISGAGEIEGAVFGRGDVWLLEGRPAIRASAPSQFLRTYAP
jgi:mannose-6-phosphate isomerase